MIVMATAQDFVLETAGVRLRPLLLSERELYIKLYSSARVMRFIAPPLTVEQAEKSFQAALMCHQKEPLQRLFLAVLPIQQLQAVGICAVTAVDWQLGQAEIGNMLLPEAQGRGYAESATLAVVAQLRHRFGCDHIYMDIDTRNIAAIRAAGRIGFKADKQHNRKYIHTEKEHHDER